MPPLTTCDNCSRQLDYSELIVNGLRRPSDPQELVSTLGFCIQCAEELTDYRAGEAHIGGWATPAEWREWFDKHAAKNNLLWISV